jgi:hypothetical protein
MYDKKLKLVLVIIAGILAIMGLYSQAFAQGLTHKPPMGTTINWDHPQMDGLIAWWLFQEHNSTEVRDLVNGHVGTLSGFRLPPFGPGLFREGWQPWEFGQTLYYDITDVSAVTFTTVNSSYDTTAALSVCAWVEIRDGGLGLSVHNIAAAGDTTAGGLHGFLLYANDDEKVGWGDAAGVIISTTVLSPEVAYHVAATYNGGTGFGSLSLYINGVLEAVTTAGAFNGFSANSRTFSIGSRNKDGTQQTGWDGYIDDVRIYNRELTPEEVADIAMPDFPMFEDRVGLWATILAGTSAAQVINVNIQ